MARSSTQKNYFNLTGGLITEANPLTYPENSAADIDNMDLKRNGSVGRRRGMDQEKGGTNLQSLTHAADYYKTHYTSSHEWRSVGGDGSINVLLVQLGDKLYFHSLDTATVSTAIAGLSIDTTVIGGAAAQTSIDLSLNAVLGADVGLSQVDISFGKGAAFVVGPTMEAFLITYDSTTAIYTVSYVGNGDIFIRDFAGDDSGIAVDTRPLPSAANIATLKTEFPQHYYNLRNQGWEDAQILTYLTGSTTPAVNVAPSNADVWWYGKTALGAYSAAEMELLWYGSMQAPRGRYIWSAYSMVRHTIVAGATTTATAARVSATCFYSGRVWYAGVKDPNLAGTIMFSRIVENPLLDAHKCYQDADPTSEIISDLVANDGGTIQIPEAGKIIKMIPLVSGVVVFADNGVWHIKGTADTGFSALGYAVEKVTNVGTTARDSIVEVEGNIAYWARSGIYLISLNSNSLSLAATNITQETIQGLINDVDDASLANVQGVYDRLEREIKWVYTTTAGAYPQRAVKALTLDLVLKAWYPATYAGTEAIGTPHIIGAFSTLPTAATAPNYESMARFLVMLPTAATTTEVFVAVSYRDDFLDWFGHDSVGIDSPAFIEFGNEMHGDAMRDKQLDEVHFFFSRTEDTFTNGVLDNQSSCLYRVKWDWADTATGNKWSNQIEAYKFQTNAIPPTGIGVEVFDYGQNVISSKHTVSGSGRSFRMRIDSSAGKDIQFLGWATFVSGVTR